MRASVMLLAAGSEARELSLIRSFAMAIAIGLSMLALAAPATAQDAPKAEPTSAPPAAASEGTTENGRHHGRKHADAKSGAAAKADRGAKPDTAATGDGAGKVDSSAVAVVKEPAQECRTVRPTGSRLPQRICATPEQWKEVDARGEAGAKEMKRTIESSSSAVRSSPPLPGGGFP